VGRNRDRPCAPRLTIAATVVHALLKPRRELHPEARRLSQLAHEGKVHLAMAKSGRVRDIEAGSPMDKQLQEIEHLEETEQLPIPPLILPFTPGQGVGGFSEAWRAVLDDWRTHEGKPPQSIDAMHVETHLLEERDVFITDDKSLLAMCRQVRDEHGFKLEAMGLFEYLQSFERGAAPQ
jgi:hypothetical protein